MYSPDRPRGWERYLDDKNSGPAFEERDDQPPQYGRYLSGRTFSNRAPTPKSDLVDDLPLDVKEGLSRIVTRFMENQEAIFKDSMKKVEDLGESDESRRRDALESSINETIDDQIARSNAATEAHRKALLEMLREMPIDEAERTKSVWKGIFNKVHALLDKAAELLFNALRNLARFLMEVWDRVVEVFEKVKGFFVRAWDFVTGVFQ